MSELRGRLTMVPKEPAADDLQEQVAYLRKRVLYMAQDIERVAKEVDQARQDSKQSIEDVARGQHAAIAGLQKRLDEAVSAGTDRAWYGLALTAMGVALAGLGTAIT